MMIEAQSIVTILAVFLVAGTVKGIIGLGLPSISLGFLTLAFNLPIAMTLLLAPSAVTNLIQGYSGGRGLYLVKKLWPFYLSASLMICLGSSAFHQFQTNALTALLGVVLILYAVISLFNFQLPVSVSSSQLLAVSSGTANGVLTGLTGSFVVPGVMYLQTQGLSRDEFIQSMGILFTLSTLMLGAMLFANDLVSLELTLGSMIGVIPAIIGMAIGQHWRKKLSDGQYRLAFFYAILVLGITIVARATAS